MSIVKEVEYEINFWSPPLKKHVYSMDTVGRRIRKPKSGATGVLMDELQRRDKIARESGLLVKSGPLVPLEPAPLPEDAAPQSASSLPESSSTSGILHGNPYAGVKDPVITEAEPPKRKFRSLQKLENMLYDDTLVKLGELEDEAFEELNADGYYDEIRPIDADDDFEFEDNTQMKKIILLVVIIIILFAGLIAYVKFMF